MADYPILFNLKYENDEENTFLRRFFAICNAILDFLALLFEFLVKTSVKSVEIFSRGIY